MNINTKAVIASTLFTAVLAGTSAFAQQDSHRADFENLQTSASVEVEKVNLQAQSFFSGKTVLSSKK